MRASVRSFLVGLGAAVAVFVLPRAGGAGDPDSLRQLAAPCVARSLRQTTPMLSELLTCLEGAAGLEADSVRAWAGRQLEAAEQALGEEGNQTLLASRWATDTETSQVDPKRGVKYLQSLCKELAKALDSGRNYSLQTLLEKAGASARLPGAQLRPAVATALLAAGVSAPDVGGAAGDTVDLELAVLSEEMLDRVPKSAFLTGRWEGYYDYQIVLGPAQDGTTLCNRFFLTPQFKQELWDQVAAQLTTARVCRRVLVPQEGHQVRVPRLTVMATLRIAEAQHNQAIPFVGGGPFPRVAGQISQRLIALRSLMLLLELKWPDAPEPSWSYWSAAAVDVTGLGHSPFPGDTRRYPEGLIYSEPIVEDAFIDKLTIALAPR